MAQKGLPQPTGRDWPPDRTLSVLRQQLAELEKLQGRQHIEAHNDEQQWAQLTKAVLIHGFGDPSDNLSNFNFARWAGIHNRMGVSPHQQQINFQKRIEEYRTVVRSSIAEIEVSLPETESKGAYQAGNGFEFYQDLKGILSEAASSVFVIDNYLDTEFFELYVVPIPERVDVRILTDKIRSNLQSVAKKYSHRGNFELKTSAEVHDRHVFIDHRAWVIGQSIKDAAVKKPTYMVELNPMLAAAVRKNYDSIWERAAVAVKG